MKLQEGKEYVDGTGAKVQVKLIYPGTKYPFERTTEDNPLRHMEDGRYLDSVNMPVNIFDLKEMEVRSNKNNRDTNVDRLPGFNQVCVWPTTQTEQDPNGFVEFMRDKFLVRVQHLEDIYTLSDMGKEGTGNRCDAFFAVHDDDIAKFAVKRLSYGIRWIEDALARCNYHYAIYPHRVFQYKTWEADGGTKNE